MGQGGTAQLEQQKTAHHSAPFTASLPPSLCQQLGDMALGTTMVMGAREQMKVNNQNQVAKLTKATDNAEQKAFSTPLPCRPECLLNHTP